MRKLSLLITAVLLPLAAMADPWGSKALGDAIAAFLMTGFTTLWMLVYLVVVLMRSRKMRVYFWLSALLTLVDAVFIAIAYNSNRHHDELEIFGVYLILMFFYAFVIYRGILNIRKPTEGE